MGQLDEEYMVYLEEQWAKQPDPLPSDFGKCNICEEDKEDESKNTCTFCDDSCINSRH